MANSQSVKTKKASSSIHTIKVKSTITVAIPMHRRIPLRTNQNIPLLQESFRLMRNSSRTPENEKVYYDRCLSVLYRASRSGGTLKQCAQSGDASYTVLSFTFGFDQVSKLLKFAEGLENFIERWE